MIQHEICRVSISMGKQNEALPRTSLSLTGLLIEGAPKLLPSLGHP